MANGIYTRGLYLIATSGIQDWSTQDTGNRDNICQLLVSSNYVFAASSNTVSDISSFELTSASYTANGTNGRKLITSISSIENDTIGLVALDMSNVDWTGMNDGDSIGGIITFLSSTSDDGTNQLIWYHEYGGGAGVTPAGTLTNRWNDTSGAAYLASGCS